MEILLAIVVASAVIFFGALISMGNERQRRAIDGLREQVVLWAIQDLKIKREHLTREVRVEDSLGWLNKLVAKAWGYEPGLQVVETFNEPQALVCTSRNGVQVIFSPHSPAEIRAWKQAHKSRFWQSSSGNPLLALPRGVQGHKYSVLNSGAFFDVELSLAWNGLTGHVGEHPERLWMYNFR